jgi:outer membrane protein assembly factor BamD (BamD/ComL family)
MKAISCSLVVIACVGLLSAQQGNDPEELLRLAKQAKQGHRYLEGINFLNRLLEKTGLKDAIRREALFLRAELMFKSEDYSGAQRGFEAFVRRYRGSEKVTEAIRMQFECALRMAEYGEPQKLLGIPIFKTSRPGLELIKVLLSEYPYEEFSDGYRLWLADYYFKKKDYVEAAGQYETIYRIYQDKPSSSIALFKLGLCKFKMFDSVDYDVMVLKEASKHLQEFIAKFSRHGLAPRARRMLKEIDERLAEKEFKIAQFYIDKGKPKAAKIYLRSLLKRYPKTRWAKEAKRMLKDR